MVAKNGSPYFTNFPSPFGNFSIIWKDHNSSLQIQRIFLSDAEHASEEKVKASFTQIKKESNKFIEILGEKIQRFLKGEAISFDLKLLDFNRCYDIQKRVLIAEYEIPRGWVSTYKRIANNVGLPKGARVVGNALAKNPFPIIIPCHRAIKTNGDLGGFQGGVKMKRALLEQEGIKFSNQGKVITKRLFY